MHDTRFNKIIGIFGRRGTGKTLYLLGSTLTAVLKDKILKKIGLLDIFIKQGKKILIIDTFPHPAYSNIPIMPMDKLKYWQSGVYRVIINIKDIAKLNKLLYETPSVWNSVLVYEDTRKHTFGKVDEFLIALMGDSKQRNIDMVFMYHNFGECPPDLFRKLDYINCFKTNDSPECRKRLMPGYYQKAMDVYNKVKNHASEFFCDLIDTGND